MKKDAHYYIQHLGLEPHPEGGYYKSSFASKHGMDMDGKKRHLFTSIYFLLESGDVSHFHRLKSDEVWYFHGGSPLIVHVIDEAGNYTKLKLGLDIANGEMPQVIVPRNSIFGSTTIEGGTFSLVGCMVSPGFDFEDFELFTQEQLMESYPQHEKVIGQLAYRTL